MCPKRLVPSVLLCPASKSSKRPLTESRRWSPAKGCRAGPRTAHNRTALMHDSIVERNGARTGPALESGVTGSSGSFSKGLGATPPSHPIAAGEYSLISVQPLSELTTARHLIVAPDHDISQRNPTDWYGQVGRNIGTARRDDAVDPRVGSLHWHSARVLACSRAGWLACSPSSREASKWV